MTSDRGAVDSGLEGPIELSVEQFADLRQAYLSPPRAYHHFGHVQEVLRHYQEVANALGWHRPIEVWLAVLYHDAIYVPGHRDNEAASARLAAEHIGRWQRGMGIDAQRVHELIMLTARHGGLRGQDLGNGDTGDDARLFLDCDMAILGAPPDQFARYDRAIADEYRAAPRWLYRARRRQFFKKLLASERIFLSEFFRERYEGQARDNLAAALGGKIAE